MSARAARSEKPFCWPRIVSAGGLAFLAMLAVGVAPASAAARSANSPGGKAWVRAAHLIPGVGAARIDLVPTGQGEAASVQMSPRAAYGDVTSYQRLKPGTYTITVQDVGAAASATPMLSRSLTISADKAYTLAMLGTAAAPRLATLADDLTPPKSGEARVRVLPAAAQAPQVTVVAKNGPTLVDNAVLGQASAYASVPAGSWKLTASTPTAGDVAQSIAMASGSVYTLVLLDGPSGKPRLSLITDAAGTTTAPQGGAETGGGGMATSFVSSPSVATVLPATLVLLFAVMGGFVVRARYRADS